mmetsp:Transcript_11139/g.14558  ORF Transcript_11139/g.14558 Transcript_11139/m.14558 type:complete len:93 (+) Transcript_11139:113-391(+)
MEKSGPLGKAAPARGPNGQAVNRRRPAAKAGSSRPAGAGRGGAGGAGGQAGILRFYTDEAPGLKIGPTVVLFFSVSFIGIVVLLHIWGKFRS